MNWINVKERLPEREKKVLTAYRDEGQDGEWQIDTATYFRKGNEAFEELSATERKTIFATTSHKSEKFLAALFALKQRIITEDGFYLYDFSADGLVRWRRHADIITHWAEIVPPEEQK